MAKRKYDFNEGDKIKVLLWCGRHCCLCGKFSGIGIEIAHLEKTKSDIDNAMPLCFDCHASIGHYNKEHPRGKKYSVQELKARRDQIYEQHTRHLISPVHYLITQQNHQLPRVGFQITNLGDIYPVKAKIVITLSQGNKLLGTPETKGHYNGKYLWNLNPRFTFGGNFPVPDTILENKNEPIKAKVELTIIDIYDREHVLLPGGFVKHLDQEMDWYAEPSEEELKPQ